jgi:hypothetical protein
MQRLERYVSAKLRFKLIKANLSIVDLGDVLIAFALPLLRQI